MLSRSRARLAEGRRPARLALAGVLAAFAIFAFDGPAPAEPASNDPGPASKAEARVVFTAPAQVLSAAQRAQLDAKRAMVERMTPTIVGTMPIKGSDVTTVVPGTGNVALGKPFDLAEAKRSPVPSEGGAAVRVVAADPPPSFAGLRGCRLAGLCKSGDRAWVGTEQVDVDGIPSRMLPAPDSRRQP